MAYLLQYVSFQPQPSSQDDLVQLSQEAELEPVQVTAVEPEVDKAHQVTMKGILSSDPLPEETIASDQPIAIQFSQPVDLSGVQPAKNVQLYPSNDANGTAGDGFFNTEVRYGHDGQGNEQKDMLVFTPSFPFQSGQTYRLILRAGKPFPLEEDFVLTFNVQ